MRISDWSSDVCSSDLRAAGLRFAFILRDDGRFHLAAAADRVTQRGLIEREQGFEILFEPGKESGITEHAVLDDFGDAGEPLALRQARQADRKSTRLNSSH